MIITCKNCNTSFSLDDELVKDTGTKVRCSKCHHVFQAYPSYVHQETEFQENEAFARTVEDKKDFSLEADDYDDLDLSEIDKLLQEEEADLSAESGSYQRVDEQKDSDDFDFEFEDPDELLAEKDKSDLNPKTDPHISSLESFAEEIDLSELDDFFKEDETQVESFLEPDEDSKESIFEFDPEVKNILEPPEAEDIESSGKVEDIEEEIEDIDFSDLDDLFGEDESQPVEDSELFQDIDSMSEKSEEFSDIDNLLDSEKELSLNDTSEKTDDQFGFELEIENQEDSEAEVARNKEDPDPDSELELEFDLDLTMEDDLGVDPLAEKKEAETDFEFDLDIELEEDTGSKPAKDKEDSESELDFDLDLAMEDDLSEEQREIESSQSLNTEFDLELDAEENTEAEGKTLDDEEFDLSDLENIIDREEESDNEVKFSTEARASEMEDDELEFELHLDPDDEKWTSPEVVFEKVDLQLDNSEKIAGLGSGPEYQDEENAHEFYAQKTLGASFEEKDDYDVEENRGKFQEAFETVTLISHPIQDQQEESVESKLEKKPKKRLSKTILVAFILFILAAAGYGAFTVFKPMNIQIPFIGNFMKDQPVDPGSLQMHISDLHSRFMDNQNGERIFIITGMVKNEYQETRSLVKITGKLYQSERQLTQNQQVYAGNTVSDLELFSLKPEVIKNRLNNRFGENRTNLNVQPNQSISFMIVFSNLPQNLEEFTVEIDGSSPV
jgi:predicted Zn finger-like uncharacterized protein